MHKILFFQKHLKKIVIILNIWPLACKYIEYLTEVSTPLTFL